MIFILLLNTVAFLFMLGVNFISGIFVAYLKILNATEIIISIGASALYLARGTSSVLIHKISRFISFKKLFIITFIGSAISSLLIALPTDPLVVAILRTIQGFFSGFYWVLINIYAAQMGSKFINRFKNLSAVTISLNLGGFLGSVASGKIAATYNPHLSFYIGFVILAIGAFVALKLEDIKDTTQKTYEPNSSGKLLSKEKLIIFYTLFSSSVFAYVTIGIPLYILKLGGSYKEIGYISGLGILSAAVVMVFAPIIKKRFSYKTIMTTNYILILINLFLIFYFNSIWIIYFSHSILIAIAALEKNLWYAILQQISKNFNKSIGLLKGSVDYFGTIIFILYGFLIQTFGHFVVVLGVSLSVIMMIYIVLYNNHFKFLRGYRTIHLRRLLQYKNILYRANT